jgi:hypothetical protein
MTITYRKLNPGQQALVVLAVYAGAGFDLEGDDLSVVTF